MIRYAALIDGKVGAFGVVFPDLPGVCAMGDTIGEALANAEDVLHDYAVEIRRDGSRPINPTPPESIKVPRGAELVSIPLIETSR